MTAGPRGKTLELLALTLKEKELKPLTVAVSRGRGSF